MEDKVRDWCLDQILFADIPEYFKSHVEDLEIDDVLRNIDGVIIVVRRQEYVVTLSVTKKEAL